MILSIQFRTILKIISHYFQNQSSPLKKTKALWIRSPRIGQNNAEIGLVWNSKHDLAELPALFKIRLRGGGLFEREDDIDDGFNPRGIQETQELAKLFPASEGRAENLQVLGKNRGQIIDRLGASSGAAGDQPAARSQSREALSPNFSGPAVE